MKFVSKKKEEDCVDENANNLFHQLGAISHCWINPNTDLAKLSTPIISVFKFQTELIDLLPAIVIDTLQDKKNYMTTLSLFMTLECRIVE